MCDNFVSGFEYPKRVGSAADLMFAELSPITYLIDCLVLYDTVVIPASYPSLMSIYSGVDPGQLDILFCLGRIKYCPAKSMPWSTWDLNRSYVDNIFNFFPFDKGEERYADLRGHLTKHMLDTGETGYNYWETAYKEAETVFYTMSERKGYEWLVPSGPSRRDRITGLMTGMARINDLMVAGITALDLDVELATYLDICFPAKAIQNIMESEKALHSTPQSLIKSLHRIENLPPLGEMVRCGQISSRDAIRMVVSEEAAELRNWLAANVAPGVDVRDAYHRTLKELPSKKAWTGWARFGAVSGVTTALASLVTLNPAVGAGVGLLIGAADQGFGGKVTEMLVDRYHPHHWLSYIRRTVS